MASKGVTIAISGTYNGRALEKARQDLEKLQIKATAELETTGGAFVRVGAQAAELGGTIHNVGYKMEQFGAAATTYITLPILAAGAACASAAIEIDDSLTSVKKTVDGTEEEYQQLKQAAIDFSKTNAVSASQILDIQALGAQLGYAIDELDMFSQTVSGLDIATNMDAETAATELAQFANITKMAHSETENYGSAVVALGNNLATTEADISAMAQRLAAAGSQIGMSQADILGLAGAMTSLGLSAEAGGTALSTIMSNIDKDVAKSTDGLAGYVQRMRELTGRYDMDVQDFLEHIREQSKDAEKLAASYGMTFKQLKGETLSAVESVETWADAAGMSADQFAQAWLNDPVEALSAVLSGMEAATYEGSNMSLMLEELGITTIRQTDAMKRMAGNSQLVADAVQLANDAWVENTALTKEVDNRNASMSSRIEILKNRVTAVAEEVGTPLVNALLDAVDALEPLFNYVSDAAEGFASLSKEEQQNKLKMVAIATAAGPVATVLGKVAMGAGDVVTGFGKVMQKAGVFIQGMSDASEACGGLGNVLAGVATGTLDLGDAAKTAEGGVSMAATATTALGTALKALAIAGVVAALAALALALKEVYDHFVMVEDATKGLETATDAAAKAYDGFAVAGETATKSVQSITDAADDCLQAQANLAQTARDTWTEYGNSAATVDYYAGRIKDLGSKSELTAEEQTELKNAVDQYNQLTGASLSIIDEQTGALNLNADAIDATTQAYKEQAVARAAGELYNEVIKQQIADETELANVSDALKQAEKDYANALVSGNIVACANYALEIMTLKQRQDDLTKAVGSAETTAKSYLDLMNGSGQKFDSLQDALKATGTSLEDLGITTKEQWDLAESKFDGSLSSIVKGCNEYGIKIPQTLADAINSQQGSIESASKNMGDNAESGLKGVPTDMRNLGVNASKGYANGIKGTSAYSAGQTLGNTAKNGAGSVSAKSTGTNFAQGFANGMKGVNIWNAAYNMGMSALNAIKSALGIASPSKEAEKVGAWFGEGAVLGMQSTEQAIAAESQKLSDAMSLTPSYGDAYENGAAYGQGYATGKTFNFNINVNVNGTADATSAASIGRNIGQELYLEFARRERAYA